MRQNISLGVGLEQLFGQNTDMIGLGLSWGEPSVRRLSDQYTVETFYGIFITPDAHDTPSVQVIMDPSNAPTKDSVAVLGLRLRTLY